MQAMFEAIYDSNHDSGFWIFLLLTVVMGGGAAYVSANASPLTWRPFCPAPLYMLPLAAAVRFCHFALFAEPFLSLKTFSVAFAVALVAPSFGFRLLRAGQMARQYD